MAAQPRKATAKTDEAAEKAAVASSQAEDDQKASSGVKRRYRATMALGGVRRGEVFEAADDDPRVLAGHVELLEDQQPPDAVSKAFDQQ